MQAAARPQPPHGRRLAGTAISLVLLPGFACSQEATSNRPIDLPGIVVTGSHIGRAGFETSQPLIVLDRQDLQRAGLTSVGEILQQLPQHVSDLNSDYNNGGNGETRVDLRNLGARRTLVLLNGHRYVTALDGAVDVASIPLPIVDRIEVLTDGASAIYGSDAIAGVVNIITRDDYAGVEASAYYASNDHGDGERRAADITWGRQGERGGIALNLSFADQQPIWAGDRAISAVPTFNLPANDPGAGASQNTPQGRLGFGPHGVQLPDDSEGQLTWDPALAAHRPFDFRSDGYNFAPENYLRTPYERTALFGQADYQLGGQLRLRSELLLHRRRSSQQLAPTPLFQLGAEGDPYNFNIATDSLYNPFGQPITFFSFRPLNRPRRFTQLVDTWYLTLGLEGAFALGPRSFNWNLNGIVARTRNQQHISGGYNLQRLGFGVGPSFLDASGAARCGTPGEPVDDCVPLDFAHGQDGFTDAMYDYISSAEGDSETTQRLGDFTFNVSGALLDLPSGPLTAAFGLEHRRERVRVALDPLLTDKAFDFGGNIPEPLQGETRINEAFVELAVPLLANRRWADALDLSLAARYSDYSTFGSTSNAKLGLGWRPTISWLLRATWSQGYRAPSASELYALTGAFQITGLDAPFFDPCAQHPTGVVAERCLAAGVPLDGFDPKVGPAIRFGSNPDLQPERARNRTIGVVWSPHTIEGLDASLDWWHITLRDAIDAIPDYLLPILCYRQGATGACEQLSRDPVTGVLTLIDARQHNYGTYEIEGYDVSLGYRRDTRLGEFALRWDSVYLSRYLKEVPKGALLSTVGNYFQWDPGWRVRSLLSLDWNRPSFGATLRLRYYSPLDESCFLPADVGVPSLCDRPDFESPTFNGDPEHVIDARTYTDLQWRWEPWPGTQFAVGLDNAFDRDPPVAYSSFANSYDPSYDVPGRFWYVRIQHTFQ